MQKNAALLVTGVWLVVTSSPLDAGIVGHWPLDGDLLDRRATARHGVFSGGEGPGFVEDRAGRAGGSLHLDGTDDRIRVDRAEGSDIPPSPERSIALWVRGEAQTDRSVWSEVSGQIADAAFSLGPDFRGGTGRVDVFLRDDSGVADLNHVLSEATAFDGEWHHIAWVDSGGDALLYIDGRLDPVSFRHPGRPLALDLAAIGAGAADPACCHFSGEVDDVRIYNHAIGEEEIAALVGGGDPVPFADRRLGVAVVARAARRSLPLGAPICRSSARPPGQRAVAEERDAHGRSGQPGASHFLPPPDPATMGARCHGLRPESCEVLRKRIAHQVVLCSSHERRGARGSGSSYSIPIRASARRSTSRCWCRS